MWLDCDVLQADGGTRCAAICGAYVAARRARSTASASRRRSPARSPPCRSASSTASRCSTSNYAEDSTADVDVNVVMTGDGRLVEVQATAEQVPFDRARLDALLDLAAAGIEELALHQREAIDAPRD